MMVLLHLLLSLVTLSQTRSISPPVADPNQVPVSDTRFVFCCTLNSTSQEIFSLEYAGLMMELLTSEVGCLCQVLLQELDLNMAALEVLLDTEVLKLDMEDNSLDMDNHNNLPMERSLPMVDNNHNLGMAANLAMEVKEDMGNLLFPTPAMALDL